MKLEEALAGPVVASAVAVRKEFYDTEWCKRNASRINDSKLLAPDEREYLYGKLSLAGEQESIAYRGWLGRYWGDRESEYPEATQAAMRRAVESVLEALRSSLMNRIRYSPMLVPMGRAATIYLLGGYLWTGNR